MPFKDVIVLGAGHALIMGHCPDKITPDLILKRNEDTSRFSEQSRLGFFDSYAPNLSNYYPEVTAEDFIVKEDDLAKPLVRALSEVVVHKSWNPIDFSLNSVLKKATKLLEAQTVYINHDAVVGNELGSVANAFWENSYKTEGGIIIPAGINALLHIDAKSNPKLVRGMNMKPPSIHSLSVTVAYEWEMSHNLSSEDFFNKMGTYDADGKMIRKIANKVSRFSEISFVTHGADPYAQIITPEGVINNPKFAEISNNSDKAKQAYFFFDFQEGLSEDYFKTVFTGETQNSGNPPVNTPTIPTGSNNNNPQTTKTSIMKREALLAMAAVLTLQHAQDVTDDALAQLVSDAVRDTATKLGNLQTQNDTLKAFQDARLEEKRGAVIANYEKLMGEKKDESVITMLKSAGWDVLTSFESTYQSQLEEKFPLTCQDCHSHNISRASAGAGKEGGSGGKGGTKSFDAESFVKNRLRKGGLKLPSMLEENS